MLSSLLRICRVQSEARSVQRPEGEHPRVALQGPKTVFLLSQFPHEKNNRLPRQARDDHKNMLNLKRPKRFALLSVGACRAVRSGDGGEKLRRGRRGDAARGVLRRQPALLLQGG